MADLVIRGMEMPKENDILVFDTWHGKMYARSTANTGTRRYEVVSLSEGHGRLGDLDALSKEFEHLASLDWNQKAAPYSWAYAYSEAQAAVDDSPTIVPAEGGTDNG